MMTVAAVVTRLEKLKKIKKIERQEKKRKMQVNGIHDVDKDKLTQFWSERVSYGSRPSHFRGERIDAEYSLLTLFRLLCRSYGRKEQLG